MCQLANSQLRKLYPVPLMVVDDGSLSKMRASIFSPVTVTATYTGAANSLVSSLTRHWPGPSALQSQLPAINRPTGLSRARTLATRGPGPPGPRLPRKLVTSGLRDSSY